MRANPRGAGQLPVMRSPMPMATISWHSRSISNPPPLTAGRTPDGRATLTFPRRLSADALTCIVEVSSDGEVEGPYHQPHRPGL